MCENHVIARHCHLIEAIVEKDIRGERERVCLIHLHVSEGIEGIAGLIIAGAITGEDDIIMAKTDIAAQNLCIAVDALVIKQFVGVQKNDMSLALRTRTFGA